MQIEKKTNFQNRKKIQIGNKNGTGGQNVTHYVKLFLNSVIEIEKIISLHYFKYIKTFWGEGEVHDFWEMVYVDAGEIEAIADDQHYFLKQGEAIFHRPMEYHNVIAHGKFASAFVISFECFSSSIHFFDKRIMKLSQAQQNIIAGILAEGKNAYQGPFDILNQAMLIRKKSALYGAEQMVKTQLEQLLISLVRSHTEGQIECGVSEPQKLSQNKARIIDTVITILSENINREISLDYLCQRVAFSRSYIEKIFYEEMKCGVKQHFMLMKVERAKQMISEQHDTFTEIAAGLGFNSIHYFSRTFKKYTGMTPTQYQRSVLMRGLL